MVKEYTYDDLEKMSEKQMKKVKKLNCSIQPSIDKINLLQLNYLELNVNNLSIEHLKIPTLKTLILSNCNFNNFSFSDHVLLEQLSVCVSSVNLSGIKNLIKLKYLNLQNDNLFLIYEEIYKLNNLEFLNLSRNKIQSVSDEINELKKLYYLHLDDNLIDKLPDLKLKKLEVLTVKKNEIKSLSNNFELPNLNDFDASENLITELDFFNILHKLNYFHLQKNKINSIKGYFFRLTPNLITLNLSENNLSFIPPIIEVLKKLQNLNLSGNLNLKELPKQFLLLTELKNLNISSTNISSIVSLINSPIENLVKNNSPVESIDFENYKKNLLLISDGENVHDSSIQKSLNWSIKNIFNVKSLFSDNNESLEDFIFHVQDHDEFLTVISLIYELFDIDEKHALFEFKIQDLFNQLWSIIKYHQNFSDLLNIFISNILETSGICFMGKIAKLISTLDGFVDYVRVSLSDSERLSFIFSHFKNKKEIEKELISSGFNLSDEKVKEWMNFIDEN